MLFSYMTYNEIYRYMKECGIPLADIKVVFDGYFHMPFDSIGIHGMDEGGKEEEIHALAKKLVDGYPVSYLVGYCDILSMRIYLNSDTLIPRIETADFLYSYLRENYSFHQKKILDLCTGSGFIALALKKYYPDCMVVGSDISIGALSMAKKNAKNLSMDISFLRSDFLKDIQDRYDVIVSNPPYIEENNPDVDAPFEPALALFSGKDGLDSYRSIFASLDEHLTENGIAFFEMESTNVDKTLALLKEILPHFKSEVIDDLYGKRRFLKVERISSDSPLSRSVPPQSR